MKSKFNNFFVKVAFLFVFLLSNTFAIAQKVPKIHTSDTKTATGSGTALSVNRPENLEEGNLVVLILSTQRSATGQASGFATPDGFTFLRSEHDQSFNDRPEVAVFYKIADDNEPSQYTTTLTEFTNTPQWSALAMRITRHDPIQPVVARSGRNSGNMNTTELHLPTLNNLIENTLVLTTVGVRRAISNILIPSDMSPAGIINGQGTHDADESNPTLFAASKEYEAFGQVVPQIFSWEGTAKAAGVIFAIRPDVTSADLQLTASVSNPTPQRGEEVTLTITARNNGYANATGVNVNVEIPEGYTYLWHDVSQGDYDPSTELWSIGKLNDEKSAELKVRLLITCSTDAEHDINLSISGDQNDSNWDNNEITTQVEPHGSCPVVAVPDQVTIIQGQPAVINVLDNDLLSDYDPAEFNRSNIVVFPVHGSLIVGSNGQVTYLPDGNYVGDDSFRYRICSSPDQCSEAVVSIEIEPDLFDVCLDAVRPKTYYLPFPEEPDYVLKGLINSASSSSPSKTDVRSILSIKINYPKTVIVYDHWEDGYEEDITNPQQSSTEIWGDGDPTNGVAPGYPDDIIPAGGEIIIDEQFKYNRSQFNIQYDGRDKLYSTNDIAVSKVVGSANRFNLQNIKTDVIDTERFGRSFIIGFGEDLADANVTSPAHDVFRYVGVFIRAAEDNTFVELDYDGDGVVDVTETLDEGGVWFYDGTSAPQGTYAATTNKENDIKAGARIIADKPVGVDILFTGLDNYGTRNFYILPAQFYGSRYISPLHTTNSEGPVLAYFYNSSANPVTLNWKAGTGHSGSIELPSLGMNYLHMEHKAGYSFESENDEPYTAVVVIDADDHGSSYDWAYPMVPTERLTNFASIAWAPGSTNLSVNYNPIWVTAEEATTVYVKWDGNLSEQNAANFTPCGLPYDEAHSIDALEALKLFDYSDNDQSGAAVFTCEDGEGAAVPFSAVWGQDAGIAPSSGDLSMDVGYLMIPRCLNHLAVANDDMEVTEPDEPVIIDVLGNDAGYLCTLDPESVTILEHPENGTVEVNLDGTVTYTPNPGFMGDDIFTYSVCANEYANTCDDAVVKVNVRSCEDGAGSAGTNVVRGRVFVEQSPYDGEYTGTETLARGVKVNLYADNNCNGVVDTGEELLASVITTPAGRFSFDTGSDTFAKDEFPSSTAYDSNNGTVNWATIWDRSSSSDVSLVTDPIPGDETNYALQFSANSHAARSMDFSGATGAALKFKIRRQDMIQAATMVVTINGNLLMNITDFAGTNLLYEEIVIPIDSEFIYPDATNTVTFTTMGMLGDARYFIDDVELMQFPTCFVVRLDPSNTSDFYELGTNTEFPVSFGQLGSCAPYEYLGLRAIITAVDDEDVRVIVDVPKEINVLENDIGNPDPSSVTITEQPTNGSVTVNPDGTVSYYPNPAYEGPDSFKYTVCSLDDPNVCDEAEVTLYVSCMSTPGKNAISGIVFGDKDEDGIYDSGERGIAGIPIELYIDLNNNGQVDAGEPITETTVTDALGGYLFELKCNNEESVKDEFSTKSYFRNDGSKLWTSPWTEINDDNSATSGSIFITDDGQLRVQGEGTTTQVSIQREADLSEATSAQLRYDFVKSAFSSSTSTRDFVVVNISSDGGSSWTEIKRYAGRSAASGNEAIDISAHISTNTVIRISEANHDRLTSDEYVLFDNIEIVYIAIPEDGVFARDRFDNKAYNNNDGAIPWASDWQEENDDNSPTSGNIFITDAGKLRVQGNASSTQASIKRKVDLSTTSEASLIYTYEKSSFSSSSRDWIDIQVSLNGTDNWHLLRKIEGYDADSGVEMIDIPANYYGENTTIRIIESSSSNFANGEYVLFDHFTISMNYDNYIIKLQEPIPDGYELTTTTTIPVQFSTCGVGSCGNNFGLNAADLEIQKTVDEENPLVGENVVFTIKAINNGPGNATTIVIEDKLPSGYEYISHTTTSGTYKVSTGIWTIDEILDSETEELKITAKVLEPFDASMVYLNTAEIVSQDQSDPDLTNNKSSVEPIPQCMPELELTKIALTNNFDTPGNVLRYQFKLKNIGNVSISNPALEDLGTDDAPIYISGDANSNSVLDVGEEWIYEAEYTATQYDLDFGYYMNTATASGTSVCGITEAVEASALVYAVAKPAFTLEKEAISGHDYINIGDVITYDYKLTNIGNVTLDYFTIYDDKIGALLPIDRQLAVGADWTVTATYAVTQADLDRDSVKNIAVATTKYNEINYTASDSAVVYKLEKNYWMGGTKDYENSWAKEDNWTANYVPGTGEDIEFATEHNYGTDAVADLYLDTDRVIGDLINESDKNLIITTGNELVIGGEVIDSNNTGGTIVIKTDVDEPTGTLVFDNPTKNKNVEATVEFYNQAYECDGCGYYRNQWQYFGIPVKEADFPYLTPQLETVNQWVEPYHGNKWRPAPYAPDTKLQAFKGYEVTNSSTIKPDHIYEFTGLLNVGDAEVSLTNTADVSYQGMNLLANSYTAALPISEDAIVDAANILEEKAVYLFNTGTRDQWRKFNGTSVSGIEAGRYLAVPFNLAGKESLPEQIPSMHSFMLNAKSSGSILLKYNEVVKIKTDDNTPAWRSKGQYPECSYIVMDVVGSETADRLWIFEVDGTTTGYDNGWDGYKMKEGHITQLYVVADNGDIYQVASVPDLAGTTIHLDEMLHEDYEISFSVSEDIEYRGLSVYDRFTGDVYPLNDGAEYTISTATKAMANRFRVVSDEFVYDPEMSIHITVIDNIITVTNHSKEDCRVELFDTSGKLIEQSFIDKGNTIQLKARGIIESGVYITKVTGEIYVNKTTKVIIK